MNWKVGDLAYYTGGTKIPPSVVEITNIGGYPTSERGDCSIRHPIRSHGSTGNWSCPFDRLKPINDGNEAVSWSDCAWQPKGVTA